MKRTILPKYKDKGARGVSDKSYKGECLELFTDNDWNMAKLTGFIQSELSGIINNILPIKDDFAEYITYGANDSGWGLMVYGKSGNPRFSNLPSRWNANMVGLVLLEEKVDGENNSIVVKVADFTPEDAGPCFLDELAKAVRPHWPNIVTAQEIAEKRAAEKQKRAAEKQKQAAEWVSQGLCKNCGGQLGLFRKCKSCGTKN